ncbi:MAG TPA: hypothetical protein PLR99_04410 [Polyangiaceae bacterium]|nr:hypothetical protein [Polyangiaceae bacterium]
MTAKKMVLGVGRLGWLMVLGGALVLACGGGPEARAFVGGCQVGTSGASACIEYFGPAMNPGTIENGCRSAGGTYLAAPCAPESGAFGCRLDAIDEDAHVITWYAFEGCPDGQTAVSRE